MSEVITFRVPDDAHRNLEAIGREHGLTVGQHAREIVLNSLERDDTRHEVDRSGQAPVPERLSTVERHTLAMLHKIRAQQFDAAAASAAAASGDDAAAAARREAAAKGNWERERAKVLEYGWTGEYPQLFTAIYAELPRRDSGLVMDILDMFRALETSVSRLSDEDREALGDRAVYRATFRGFDANDDHESRLLSYAQHLVVDQGRWPSLADRFEEGSPHDEGNSHHPWLSSYLQMLEVFTPIWREKIRAGAYGNGGFDLTRDELARVLGAR